MSAEKKREIQELRERIRVLQTRLEELEQEELQEDIDHFRKRRGFSLPQEQPSKPAVCAYELNKLKTNMNLAFARVGQHMNNLGRTDEELIACCLGITLNRSDKLWNVLQTTTISAGEPWVKQGRHMFDVYNAIKDFPAFEKHILLLDIAQYNEAVNELQKATDC